MGRRRAAWLGAVAIALGAAALVVVRGSGHAPPEKPAVATETPPLAPSAPDATAPATPAAAAADAGGDGPPPSQLGAAKYFADELRRRCYSQSHTEPDKHHFFARALPGPLVELQLAARGELRDAKLSGHLGPEKACLEATVAGWPRHEDAADTKTIKVAVRDRWTYRTPGGEVQLLRTGEYFEEEFPALKTTGDWRALCPLSGRSFLVPTEVTIKLVDAPSPGLNEGGHDWVVEARACAGDSVYLIKGKAITGAGPAEALPRSGDAGAAGVGADAGPSVAGVPLVTATFQPGQTLDEKGMTLTFGERTYHLWVPPGGEDAEEQVLALESGSDTEVLIDDGNSYQLDWAGDLDGDGRLDLIVAHTFEFPSYDLFLSSHAGGRLLRYAGGIRRMGD
jgi:hypothetical protein